MIVIQNYPVTIIEFTSPLVSTLNQISIDIISPRNTIETNQSPQNIILPITKIESCTEKNVKPEKEKFAFEELTLSHLFLVERKPYLRHIFNIIIIIQRYSMEILEV